MINLLSAEFYKLKKSKGAYIGLLAVAAFTFLLYASLVMIDKINQGEIANGTGGIIVTQNGEELENGGASESMLQQIGIIGMLQQMFGGHFVAIILAILVSIFVVREYGAGTIKNLVGKGQSRTTIFFAKMLAVIVLTLLFQAAVMAVIICMGLPFVGWEGVSATAWKDVAVYIGFQLLFGVTIAVIFMLIGELTRNLAAGIAVSIVVLLFSSTLTAGLDLVFHGMEIQPSRYWVIDLLSNCPTTDFTSEFLVRGVLVPVVWLVIAAALGVVHFQKADV